MPQLLSQSDFRAVRSLPFCYLCGDGFSGRTDKTRDHVPPRAIFAKEDREPPLILPTHRECNEAQSGYDEIVGQLVAVIHGKRPSHDNVRLDVDVMTADEIDGPFLSLSGVNLHNVMRRWVKGFHAALYDEFLPNETPNNIHPPFPCGNRNDNNEVQMEPVLVQQRLFVEVIKKNRHAKALDKMECCNGKCVYECVWDKLDDGRPVCIFALNVYDWKRLADTTNFPARGCVGMYFPHSGRPATGTTSTTREFSFRNIDPLDPFAD